MYMYPGNPSGSMTYYLCTIEKVIGACQYGGKCLEIPE
jgi:hypothetical protein